MKSDMVSLQINEDMVKPILEKQIQAAVMAGIGNPEQLIQKVVSVALSHKVDKNGDVSKYSSDNTHDYLDVLTSKAIREAAKQALEEWLNENKTLVKEMVIKEMNKPARQKTLVKAFADAVEDSLSCSWRFNCDVNFTKQD